MLNADQPASISLTVQAIMKKEQITKKYESVSFSSFTMMYPYFIACNPVNK